MSPRLVRRADDGEGTTVVELSEPEKAVFSTPWNQTYEPTFLHSVLDVLSHPTPSPTQVTRSPTLNREDVDKAVSVVLDHRLNGTHNSTDLELAINTLLSQGYIFSAAPYEPSGWGEIWAVVFCSVAIFVLPGLFALVAHLRSTRERRAHLSSAMTTVRTVCSMIGKVFLKFFNPLSRRDRDVERLGVEGAAILLFERELGRLLLLMALCANVVLVPLHLTSSGDGMTLLGEGTPQTKISDFIPWTIQNVPVHSAYSVLWVHVLFVYLLTWMTISYSTRISSSLDFIEGMKNKQQPASGDDDITSEQESPPSEPRSQRRQQQQQQPHHYRQSPPPNLTNTTELPRAQNAEAVRGSRAIKQSNNNASLFVEGQVNFFPSSEQDLHRAFELVLPNQVADIRIFEQRTRLKKLGEFRSVVTFKRSEDAQQFLKPRLRKATLQRKFQELLRDAAAAADFESKKNNRDKKNSKQSSHVEDTESEEEHGESSSLLFLKRGSNNSIIQDGKETDSAGREVGLTLNPATGDDLSFLSALRMDRWTIEPAPDPEDIMWDALTVDRATFICRSLCVNSFLVLSLFVFTTPIAFISFVSGVASPSIQTTIQSTYVNVVGNLRLLSPALGDFLFGFLPQLLLVICDAWLLFALQLTSKVVEPHHTHSGREISLFTKSFWFLIFNTLILPSLALSNIGAFVGDLFQNETSPFALLGKAFVTSSGAFTLTFIATQTWVGASMDVSRLSERLFFMARGYARPWASAEERRSAHLAQFEFDYGTEYAMALTMFSLCIVFATVVPPILLFGVSYFIVKQATDDHSLRHLITPQQIDNLPRAHVGRMAVRYMAVAVILLQSSMFGFFSSEICLPIATSSTPNKDALAASNYSSTVTSTVTSIEGSSPTAAINGVPCIANEYSGVLTVRGSFGQILSLVICLVFTCVVGLRSVMKAKSERLKHRWSVVRSTGDSTSFMPDPPPDDTDQSVLEQQTQSDSHMEKEEMASDRPQSV